MRRQAASPVLSISFLITGNLVGAGILGLPINTGLAGLIPSLAAMLACWGLMLGSALVIADQTLKSDDENFDLPSLFGQTLGPIGRWLAIGANLLILYGLLVAYLSGGTKIIVNALNLGGAQWLAGPVFFILTTGLVIFGAVVVRKSNFLLMLVMWAAFIGLIALAMPEATLNRLKFIDLTMLPSALPIMVTAFHFHNIIPTVCRSLDNDRAAVRRALLTGTILGLTMNGLWVLAVMGALPVTNQGHDNILYAFQNGLPATVPLASVLNSQTFTALALTFALVAITTSYLANGTALLSFSRDLSQSLLKIHNRTWEGAITFGPPLVVALVYPDLFLKALNVVGGVGIALLFGILPGLLLWRQSAAPRLRLWGLVMACCFACLLGFEIAQEMGWLRIDPEVELWKAGLRLFPK